MKSETILFPDSNSGFLSVGYRYGKFTPYAAISAVKSKKNHRAEELRGKGTGLGPLLSIADYMFSSSEENQHTATLGVRYDLAHNAALKFQMDVIRNHTCPHQPAHRRDVACLLDALAMAQTSNLLGWPGNSL